VKKQPLFLLLFLLVLSLFTSQSYSGGPLSVRSGFNGTPDRWNLSASIQGAPVGVVPFRTDLGNLGLLDNSQAVALTNSLFQAYEDIPTATIRFQNRGSIVSLGAPGSPPAGQPVDVNAANFAPYLSPSVPIGQNIVVFDADGTLFDALFGAGTTVLGFVGIRFVFVSQPFFAEGQAAYNGRFLDGNQANSELAIHSFRGVFTHETGHFVGLDHSQVNGQIASRRIGGVSPPGHTSAGIFDLYAPFTESVFPLLFSAPAGSALAGHGFPDSGFFIATLAQDDIIATSNLYPESGFLPTSASPFGAISGTIFNTNRTTPVSGVNVVVRRIDQGPFPPPAGTLAFPPSGVPSTDANGVLILPPAQAATDPLVTAASVVSGSIGPGFAPGPSIAPGNGTYQINGLPPGNYLVGIESIDLRFVGGSGVRRFAPPLQLVIEEYHNGSNESDDPAVDDPRSFVPVTVTTGQVTSGINFFLNRVPTINEAEPNDTTPQANSISLPRTAVGSINPSSDVDLFSFSGNQGDAVAINVRATRLSPASTLDPIVAILGSDGGVLVENDDTFGPDSFLAVRLPSTQAFFVRVRSLSGSSMGTYELDVSVTNPLPQSMTPILSVTPNSQDFGTVAAGNSVTRDFTVQNTGGGTLTGTASTTAPFSIMSGSPFNLTAGSPPVTVTVRFRPTAAGMFTDTVDFNSNGGDASLTVTGMATAPVPILEFQMAAYNVGEKGNATITVTRTGDMTNTVTVQYATSDGTATGKLDYTPKKGKPTFKPGVTRQTITVPIRADVVDEEDESVQLTLSNPTGGAVLGAQSTATLTIVDDDEGGTLQFSQAAVTVGEKGAARIVVMRTDGVAENVTVDYATSNGTATAGEDYTAKSGTLKFGPGKKSQTITVPIRADKVDEPNETVLLTLSNPTGGAVLGPQSMATLTIGDDD
jgi:hypothetical protein